MRKVQPLNKGTHEGTGVEIPSTQEKETHVFQNNSNTPPLY